MMTPKECRDIIFSWWREELDDDQSGEARGLSARLCRTTNMVEALSERAVQELGDQLKLGFQPEKLALLAMTLAQVKERTSQTLAWHFGEVVGQSGEGKKKWNKHLLSETRFQNIIRADGLTELATQLRRALPIVSNKCNVGRLGEDLLFWNDDIRTRWLFDYFGRGLSAAATETSPEKEEAEQ